MGFQFASLSPLIGIVVVIHVAQQQTFPGPMHNYSDIAANANRPEIPISGSIQLMELQSRLSWIQLQIKGRGLHSLLFITGQPDKAIRESMGDAEIHQLFTFIVQFLSDAFALHKHSLDILYTNPGAIMDQRVFQGFVRSAGNFRIAQSHSEVGQLSHRVLLAAFPARRVFKSFAICDLSGRS